MAFARQRKKNRPSHVVMGLLAGEADFGQAMGDTVTAGWDTDCNGATVGELALEDLVARTVAAARRLA